MADGRINPANVPDIALKDGQSIPQVGLGVLRIDDEGLARTLGVCNFMPADLKRLHEETGAWPAVNQIELHPTWQQREVVAFCKEHGIAVEAYSPMARGADLNAGNGTIEKIAAAHGVSPSPGDSALAHRKRHHHHSEVRARSAPEGKPRPVRLRAHRRRTCSHRCS